jgi:hypothetical protein
MKIYILSRLDSLCGEVVAKIGHTNGINYYYTIMNHFSKSKNNFLLGDLGETFDNFVPGPEYENN